MKHGLLITFFGSQRDRFCTYHKPLTVLEKLEAATLVPGAAGVELIYPEECTGDLDLRATLKRLSLVAAAINVNIKGHKGFVCGALSSPDPTVRHKAVKTILEAKQIASDLGCERVTCAPLADGYDYPMQTDYSTAWKRIIDSLREAASNIPEVALHLEHKPSDPRVHGFLDTPSKVLWLCRQIGHPNVGITFNVGHSLYGGGWPAVEFAHVLDEGVPCYVHHNDGTVEWDWDLIVGTQNFWKVVEFLLCAKEAGFEGWFTADIWPIRQNATEVFASSIRITDRIWNWFDSVDWLTLRESIQRRERHEVLREMTKWVLRSAN